MQPRSRFRGVEANLTESLKENARTGWTPHARLRSALVVSEIAIALVLLTISGAFLRSFQKMRAVDPGFRPDHVLSAIYLLPLQQYPTTAATDSFNLAVVDRLSASQESSAVGVTDISPCLRHVGESAYTVEGQTEDTWKLKFAAFGTIYGDYFRAMGIPLLEGRYFNQDDRAHAPLVAIVNQSMAQHLLARTASRRQAHARRQPARKGFPGRRWSAWSPIPNSALATNPTTTSGTRLPNRPPRSTTPASTVSSPAPPADTSPFVPLCRPSRWANSARRPSPKSIRCWPSSTCSP